MKYPGDSAEPKAVAKYFEAVAKSYDLPGILPVMASYVELTAAWLVPGDVKKVFGYLKAVDHWSVGYFQQQYDGNPDGLIFGWGTYEQLINAEYAVHRFCQEAVKFINEDIWNASTTDPDSLGRWCQAVQRSALPDAYRDKGYPAALELIKVEDEWPQREAAFTKNAGWLFDVQTGQFIRLPEGTQAFANNDRWGKLWVPPEKKVVKKWKWPEAWDEPWASGTYDQMFPTRYSFRADVEEWARWIVDKYGVGVNTYYAHPPYWWREHDSFDVWGAWNRRGYTLDPTVGDSIFWELFNYEPAPHIDWIIYKGRMWTAAGGWTDAPPGAADSDPGHWNHIHVTFK